MITKLRLMGALGACILAGCQSYDFEPVEPLALAQASKVAKAAGRQNTPNLMLVVDKSGSMNAPTNPGDSSCPSGCGSTSLCPAGCPTRWTELQDAMSEFLTQSGNIARMGLTTYPANAECLSPTGPRIELANTDDGSQLQAKADEIRQTINGIQSALSNSPQAGQANSTGGGTPTGNTLASLKNYGQLADTERPNFVLLLTDGLPNCNENNPVDFQSNPTACSCQAGSCAPPFNKKGCLDANGTVQQIGDLKELQITTIVVGFGIDSTSAEARDTLQRMAQAGGFPRQCPNGTNAECGSDNSCNTATKECNNKYFSAKNAVELAEALRAIGLVIGQDFCDYQLDIVPESDKFISVLIDGEVTERGPETWVYDENKVKMVGALCDRLKNAQVSSPVNVEIRVIQSL